MRLLNGPIYRLPNNLCSLKPLRIYKCSVHFLKQASCASLANFSSSSSSEKVFPGAGLFSHTYCIYIAVLVCTCTHTHTHTCPGLTLLCALELASIPWKAGLFYSLTEITAGLNSYGKWRTKKRRNSPTINTY